MNKTRIKINTPGQLLETKSFSSSTVPTGESIALTNDENFSVFYTLNSTNFSQTNAKVLFGLALTLLATALRIRGIFYPRTDLAPYFSTLIFITIQQELLKNMPCKIKKISLSKLK